ncbi:response regulator transcription factor [Rhodocytophaga aerolata]|uniref:Response regulator transcription factor n=1 Tax=Rhodocytophaga aerolata TaxID=455078 RepID=A0ABT8RDN7_9BACT|nr:response regulator transcription factor [Rhodocytophaga aerolata]MDO1450215.1 response regulator transcription factor [Rhodocytophaga aerolata]
MYVKVIVACSHLLVAEAVTEWIKGIKAVEKIAYATSFEDTISYLTKETYQVMLIDTAMPDAEQMALYFNEHFPTVHQILLLQKDICQGNQLIGMDRVTYLYPRQGKGELAQLIVQVAISKMSELRALTVTNNFHPKAAEKQYNSVEDENYLSNLSRREKEILAMITQAFASEQIADSLFISVKTVQTHRRNMMRKLGVHNHVGLLRYALQQGLL